MELKSYLAIFWRRKWVIIITALVAVLVTTIGTLLIAPQYVASATLRIALSTGVAGDSVRSSDLQYADRLMNTYDKIATSRPIQQELAQKLGRASAPDVDVTFLPNTELMQVSITDADPALAAQAANTLADILVSQGKQFYVGAGKSALDILSAQLAQLEQENGQARADYEAQLVKSPNNTQALATARRVLDLKEETYTRLLQQYEQTRANESVRENTITLIEPAAVPTRATSPNLPLNLGMALLAGLLGGVALAFLFENLDATLYSTEKIENVTQLPVLGKIPTAKRQSGSAFNNNSPQEEAFRRLRTTIFALQADEPFKTLLVTSAEPNEGKSTVIANLAFALAQTGRRVIAVDGDLRRPTLHKIFGVSNDSGLSAVLKQDANLSDAVQSSNIPGLHVLAGGPTPNNPAELLGTPHMRSLLEQLAQEFDMVLIDSPALLAATDAGVLASMADGVVQVVGYAQSQEDAVRNARRQLAAFKAKLLGVIVNRAEPDGFYSYYHRAAAKSYQPLQ